MNDRWLTWSSYALLAVGALVFFYGLSVAGAYTCGFTDADSALVVLFVHPINTALAMLICLAPGIALIAFKERAK